MTNDSSVQFDPYHKWLGIRDARRPPHHYRLLGLDLFETDLEVIREAATQRMAHIRTCSLGPHADLSQRILNELARAQGCLLDSEKRRAYDEQLRAELAAGEAPASKSAPAASQTQTAPLTAATPRTQAAPTNQPAASAPAPQPGSDLLPPVAGPSAPRAAATPVAAPIYAVRPAAEALPLAARNNPALGNPALSDLGESRRAPAAARSPAKEAPPKAPRNIAVLATVCLVGLAAVGALAGIVASYSGWMQKSKPPLTADADGLAPPPPPTVSDAKPPAAKPDLSAAPERARPLSVPDASPIEPRPDDAPIKKELPGAPPVKPSGQPGVEVPPVGQPPADDQTIVKNFPGVSGQPSSKRPNPAPPFGSPRSPPVATSRHPSPDKEPPALARSPYGPVEAGRARDRWAEYYEVQPKITNSIALPLLLVPATEFMMGSDEPMAELLGKFPDAKQQWLKGEYPQHKIHLTRPFYLGVYEVRVADFKQFCAATSYKTEAERDGKGGIGYEPAAASPFQQKPKYSWRNIGLPLKDDLPVVNVTWNDAVSFCEWLSGKEGKRYRLPTEAEWECACRAGTTGRYCNGDSPDGVVKVCNLADADAHTLFPWWNHCVKTHDGFTTLAPVGKLAPNALGLFDMHGNVAEWCGDWFSDSYYQKSPFEDPPGPETGKLRVSRGGDWDRSALDCRSSSRDSPKPADRTNYLGFRVVCEVDFGQP